VTVFRSGHLWAVLQALLVAFLWSTSFVLIKFGLKEIPAIPFAGLRYTIAFGCLLPLLLSGKRLAALRRLPVGGWLRLIGLGLLFYGVTQGAQFLSLLYLPAVATSLLLSCTTILVGLLGIVLLEERPTALQWGATVLYLGGVLLYFFPLRFAFGTMIGIVVALVGVLANALSSILGRHLNRSGAIDPLTVTTVSMGVGALILLAAGVATQGLPRLSLVSWLVILWLAIVNSAFAFTLWNRTLRTLSAMQSSIINNTMLFQIAILAWIFLDEKLSWRQAAGMGLAAVAVAVVQVRRRLLRRSS
jgi:drug/metabolite transporter (DMT)-like permease